MQGPHVRVSTCGLHSTPLALRSLWHCGLCSEPHPHPPPRGSPSGALTVLNPLQIHTLFYGHLATSRENASGCLGDMERIDPCVECRFQLGVLTDKQVCGYFCTSLFVDPGLHFSGGHLCLGL